MSFEWEKAMKERMWFQHLRTEAGGAVTLVAKWDDGDMIRVAVAWCSPADQFCKQKGRTIALGRLYKGPRPKPGGARNHALILPGVTQAVLKEHTSGTYPLVAAYDEAFNRTKAAFARQDPCLTEYECIEQNACEVLNSARQKAVKNATLQLMLKALSEIEKRGDAPLWFKMSEVLAVGERKVA